MSLHVKGLWRYPVKTLAGEPVEMAHLAPAGIPGDRIVHVRGPEGVRTSRRHYRLLGLKGITGAFGSMREIGQCIQVSNWRPPSPKADGGPWEWMTRYPLI